MSELPEIDPPVIPPLSPDAPVDQPSLDVPLPPPMVGFGSPWKPANAENRDRILDWWRAWWRNVFFPWLAAWTQWWWDQWARLIAWINAFVQAIIDWLTKWMQDANDYIEEHATEGPPGPPNVLSIGNVETLGNGVPATASIDGTSPAQTLNLGLPRGDQGIQGPPGVATDVSASRTTAILASGATEVFELSDIEDSSQWYEIEVDAACWIRTYASEAQLLADQGRAISQPINITEDHGCWLDYVSLGAEKKVLSPAVIMTDVGDGLWLSIRNLAPGPATITLDYKYLVLREEI